MSEKSQHKNILITIACSTAVVAAVAIIGSLSLKQEPETIQGQVEVSEYRVSSKVPGRILELRVKEGDYVNVGDTLAILDAPQVRAAFAVLQQAKAGLDIAQKPYNRVQRLFDEGVMTAQKRDEAFANYKAMEAQVKAAQSQYDMAVNGARMEEKKAAAAQVNRAKGAVAEVSSYINETMQIAQMAGEVSDVYPKVGELVGTGSPIMSISIMNDLWGTFNVREDQLNGMTVGSEIKAFVPAYNREIRMKVYYIKDQGSYAVWKATKSNGQYDLKTFEVKARPIDKIEGLRPGMSLVLKK